MSHSTKLKLNMDNNSLQLWILVIIIPLTVYALELDRCDTALGMETHRIPGSALSASSAVDTQVGAANARIRNEASGGAWCPAGKVSRDSYEYLQIDFSEMKVITVVETQGRFGGGQGQEYAEQYLLEYQREDGGKWFRFRNRNQIEVIQGNTNTYAAEIRELHPPIITRRIRFVPYNQHPKRVCMRVEIYGCEWTDRLVSYDMPQGQWRGNELDLSDFTYDGEIKNQIAHGGLGQLTDGMVGDHNFRLDPTSSGVKGYEWIGWRNETDHENKPITIVFKFDSIRNFTSARFHSNNMYSKDIRVFRMAKISFSIDGVFYTEPPAEFHFMRDTIIQYDRPVVVPLNNSAARYLKFDLYFDAKWILISEVHFESVPIVGTMVIDPGPVIRNDTPNVRVVPIKPLNKNQNENQNSDIGENDDGNKNQNNGNKDGGGEIYLDDKEAFVVNQAKSKKMKEEIIGIIVGILTVLILVFLVIFIVICLRNKRQKYNNNHRAMKPMDSFRNSYHVSDVIIGMTNGKAGNEYNIVASLDMDSDIAACYNLTNGDFLNGELQSRKLPDLPKTPDSTLSGTPHHYASSSVLSIQGVTGNNVYAAPQNLDLMWKDDIHIMEFPRENLKPIEKLGEGQFGEVQLCEATGLSRLLGDDFLVNRVGSKSMLVAVKMLRSNADHQARLDFNKELKVMCQLRDPNIVQVLGMCSTTASLAVIVEYMKYGDLYQYLQTHDLDGGVSLQRNSAAISYGCLIYMATQIASGMKYLESLNMVHRDLATRNCLVGSNYTIKISDFGMSRSLYSNDYYRIEGKAVLPIRWMAWESVLLGKFSSKSDVWSFGVTMWEILTFAREQPFEKLHDDEVIENCTHYFQNDGLEDYLPQPIYCPKEIYDLVRECWNTEDHSRPSFREIYMFLQRKNMGYNPREETPTSAFATLPASFI